MKTVMRITENVIGKTIFWIRSASYLLLCPCKSTTLILAEEIKAEKCIATYKSIPQYIEQQLTYTQYDLYEKDIIGNGLK